MTINKFPSVSLGVFTSEVPEQPAFPLHNPGPTRKKRLEYVAEGIYELFARARLLHQLVERSVPEVIAVVTGIRRSRANLTLDITVKPDLKEVIRTQSWWQIESSEAFSTAQGRFHSLNNRIEVRQKQADQFQSLGVKFRNHVG